MYGSVCSEVTTYNSNTSVSVSSESTTYKSNINRSVSSEVTTYNCNMTELTYTVVLLLYVVISELREQLCYCYT
jgi:uncharacterized protein YpmS